MVFKYVSRSDMEHSSVNKDKKQCLHNVRVTKAGGIISGAHSSYARISPIVDWVPIKGKSICLSPRISEIDTGLIHCGEWVFFNGKNNMA